MSTQPERRMSCWQCPRYSRIERKCQDGKANPKRKSETVEVAEVLGLQAICHYNPYRDLIALRRFFPHRHVLHPVVRTRKKRDDATPEPPPESKD